MDHIDKRLSIMVLDYIERYHSGREKAIPHKDLMQVFCIDDDGHDNHPFRRIYQNRVGSCEKGIYHIRTYAEALSWFLWLKKDYGKEVAEKKFDAFLKNRSDIKKPVPVAQPTLPGLDGAGA